MNNPLSSKIRVADYVAQALANHGIKHVFMVTGGGAMHLNDAFGRQKGMEYIACHHEQACAMAAESYFRMTQKLAAVNVTTGPGGTNAITGVWGAWVDSVGMIVVSGQVKWETLVRSTRLPLRQLGDQEIDIIKMVEGITKYSVCIEDPTTIRFHVEKALYLAENGRPGPVWIDVPMNVQGALIDPLTLKGFDAAEFERSQASSYGVRLSKQALHSKCIEIQKQLSKAKRPVVMVGAGIRLSKSHEAFLEFVQKWNVPVATCWNAHDVIWNNHPQYVGRPGTIGDRAGNFAVQNADFVLVLGSRLNIRQVSYNWDSFARHAVKAMVDVDQAELDKPTLKIDLPICADLKDFFSVMATLPNPQVNSEHLAWTKWCKERVEKYPTVLPEYWNLKDRVNPYCFVDELFKQLPENQPVVTGDGTACVVTFQAANLKKGQRLYTNSGCASMGYDLPAAIGACLALGRQKLVCIAGDGSIQMNLQELQTIVAMKLPLKIFVLNNEGYHSIRQTQRNFFPDNVVGCGLESGLSFPDMEKLAFAYGIPFRRCKNQSELKQAVSETFMGDGPQLCEVILDLDQQFSPKLSSRKLPDGRMVTSPLEDMAPFLSREEFKSNMLIPVADD